MWKQILGASAGTVIVVSAAMAAGSAVTTGNLNMRTGPGTSYDVMNTMATGSAVTVYGCLIGTSWCFVNFAGMDGWSSANWLATGSGVPANMDYGVRQYAMSDLAVVNGGTTTAFASTSPAYSTGYSNYYGSNYYGTNYYGGRIGDGYGLFGRPRLFGSGSGYWY
jgi:uncharacterized protein YraI